MSYRRAGKQDHQQKQSWQKWLIANRDLVAATGLPPSVVRTENDWRYFLRYGYHCADAYPNIDFQFEDLSASQLVALQELLNATMTDDEKKRGSAVWHQFHPPSSHLESPD